MTIRPLFVALATLTLAGAASAAVAQQVTTISVKNTTGQTVTYCCPNIAGYFSPAPPTTIASGATVNFQNISSSTTVGAGEFRYEATGGKECEFGWSAIRMGSPLSGYYWQWTKRHTSEGSPTATCTGTITAVNSTNGNMTVAYEIK
jgi:hypothetical protein